MMFAMIGCCITWMAQTIAASQVGLKPGESGFETQAEADAAHLNKAAGNASVAIIFIFGAVYSIGITPLQALYPVELLSYEQRAKGMAWSSFCVNAALVLNQWAVSISLQKIGWYTFIIWTIWCVVQTGIFYFLMPETRRRTLEELDKVFEAQHPVKASLQPHKVAVTSEGTILASEEI
jgi:Na+/melibiose symporter-like transporter